MRKILIIIIFVLVIILAMACLQKGIPFVAKEQRWAIGIYKGKDPFHLSAGDGYKNPVLTTQDLHDIKADFVADPFMTKEGATWYMFFEAMNAETKQGDIGLAVSGDGLHWRYQQIVLDEPFHLSYPYIFKWQGNYYMIPSCYQTNSVRLYQAVNFPNEWKFLKTLVKDRDCVDASIAHFQGKWWLFHSSTKNDTLYLYYADELWGLWRGHPQNPIVRGDANIARPAGKILQFNNRIFRYTQDDTPTYGNQVNAFEITELSETSYQEEKVSTTPIIKASGTGWNKAGMHHIDAHHIGANEWIACVDGFASHVAFAVEY